MAASPTDVPNPADPGDDTARRYAYQHAFGVILWIAAYRAEKDYVAIWCEQHEDFLAETSGGQFDAYQVKTRTAELGYWRFSHDALTDSITRFAKLDKDYPGQIRTFYFVSNAQCSDSKEKGSEHLSPALVVPLLAITPLAECCEKALTYLSEKTGLDRDTLLTVLQRTKLILGPPDQSITAEIVANHLPHVDAQRCCTPAQLESLHKRLLGRVHESSALLTQDPARHYSTVSGSQIENAQLRAKRIPVDELKSHLEFLQLLTSHTTNRNLGAYGTSGTAGTRMAQLIERYKAETEKDRNLREMVAKLREWHERPEGDVIGLEEKLLRGGRPDLVDFAVVAKEKFARVMMRHENSPAAQEIFAYVLAQVWVIFTDMVYPRLVAKDPPDVISRLLVENIYPRIDALLEENPLGLDQAQIKGMIFWLTGNCHLKWAPDVNLQPSA